MRMEGEFGGRLLGLWHDLQAPAVLWEIAALLVCMLVAWLLARRVRVRAPAPGEASAALRLVVFPVAATLLLVVARWALGYWHAASLLSVAIPLFAAFAGVRFMVSLLRLAIPAGAGLEAFERLVAALIWGVLALHLTGLLPAIAGFLQGVKFPLGRHELSVWVLLQGAFWVVVTLLLALWAGGALEARLMRAEGLHSSLRVVLARLGKALLVVMAVLLVLPLVGIDLTLLSVFGGALGVGLGFGLQKIASNYLSGFIILLDRSIRIGDMITADNQYGEVTRITTRYVVVRSLSGVEAIIPNDTLVTTTVLNHSYTDKRVRLSVKAQVSYATDVDAVLGFLPAVVAAHPRVLSEPPPVVLISALAESGVDLDVWFWIADPENGSGNVRSDIAARILAEFRRRGIEIPYPQREVRVLQGVPTAGLESP